MPQGNLCCFSAELCIVGAASLEEGRDNDRLLQFQIHTCILFQANQTILTRIDSRFLIANVCMF